MELAHLFALGAALSWSVSGLFGHAPSVALGSLHFNRIRMVVASLWLLPMVALSGGFGQFEHQHIVPIILSSLVGVVLGDYFLFISMQRIGPRLTAVLFAVNAPLAAILAVLFLDESLDSIIILAIIIGFSGIILAILFGKRQDNTHIWERVVPPMWIGIGAGLMAAFGQAAGVLILRPVMSAGADPFMASFIRVIVAALVLWALYPFDKSSHHKPIIPTGKIGLHILGNGFFGLSFGVALMLMALETGPVAEVTLLASISPVLILPIIWWQTKSRPTAGAFIGAGLVIISSWLLIPN